MAGTTGLRVVVGEKTVHCGVGEKLVSVICSTDAPNGVSCPTAVKQPVYAFARKAANGTATPAGVIFAGKKPVFS